MRGNEQETNWKSLTFQCVQRLAFALQHLEAKQSGQILLMNKETTEMSSQHWHDYFLEILEQIPGVRIDKEMIQTLRLPSRQQKAARKAIEKARQEKTRA